MKPELQFTPLDLRSWERGEIFYYFSKMAPTGYSLTAEVDVTELRRSLKAAGKKFYPAYLWLVTRLLNEQREFKIAVTEGEAGPQLGFYNVLTPLYAVFHEDDKTFSLMWTAYDDSFSDFYKACQENQRRYGDNHGILAQKDQLPPPNAYTVSCVPWITFNHFAVHSYGDKPYYFPSLEAGRFFERDGRTWMPLSITCHHAATDGYHVSRFLTALQEEADAFEKYLG